MREETEELAYSENINWSIVSNCSFFFIYLFSFEFALVSLHVFCVDLLFVVKFTFDK